MKLFESKTGYYVKNLKIHNDYDATMIHSLNFIKALKKA